MFIWLHNKKGSVSMFSFLKKLLGAKPNKKAVTLKKPDNIGGSFGGGPGKDSVNKCWGKVWQEVLTADERYQNIEKSKLLEIEATIREDVTNGISAQKTATKLRSLFESIGLKRKDALKMDAYACNLIYEALQNPAGVSSGPTFVMGLKFVRGMYGEVDKNCVICEQFSGDNFKLYLKDDFNGLTYDEFLKKYSPPYHEGCTCGVQEVYEDALQFINNASKGTKDYSTRNISKEDILRLKND